MGAREFTSHELAFMAELDRLHPMLVNAVARCSRVQSSFRICHISHQNKSRGCHAGYGAGFRTRVPPQGLLRACACIRTHDGGDWRLRACWELGPSSHACLRGPGSPNDCLEGRAAVEIFVFQAGVPGR